MRRLGILLVASLTWAAIGAPPAGSASAPPKNRVASHAHGSLSAGSDVSTGLDGFVMSADGRFIAFRSSATNLVPGFDDQTGGGSSIYLYDAQTAGVRLVNHVPGDPDTTGNGFAQGPNISADGRYVVYESAADDLVTGFVDNNATGLDLYVYDVAADTNRLISHTPADPPLQSGNERTVQFGGLAAISPNGTHVAYRSEATDLVTGFSDSNGALEPDVYLYDIAADTNTLLSHQPGLPQAGAPGPIAQVPFSISRNGERVTFLSNAQIVPYTDVNGAAPDLFLHERASNSNRIVTTSASGPLTGSDGDNQAAEISANGARIVIASKAQNLVNGLQENNADWDVFAFDTRTSSMRLVSFAKGQKLSTGNAGSFNGPRARISDNGKAIAYESGATDIDPYTDGNSTQDDIFLWQETKKPNGKRVFKNRLVTRDAEFPEFNQNGIPDLWGISGDGRRVLYTTGASRAVPDFEATGTHSAYTYDAGKKRSTLISRSVIPPTPPASSRASNGNASGPAEPVRMISHDGRSVAYISPATDLVASFTNNNAGGLDLYRFGP